MWNNQKQQKIVFNDNEIDNDNDNEIFFIDMKLHNVHSIYKTIHM